MGGRGADLIVPTVFFFGGCFVAMAALLMRHTAQVARRIAILETESATDALTGLANRREFERRWSAERARAHHVPGGIPDHRRVTVSVGVAGCENAASGCEAMFERADEALLAAKRAGRNRVMVAPPASAASAK